MSKHNLERDLQQLISINGVTKYNMSYDDFVQDSELIIKYFGTAGLVMFTENDAVVCFDSNDNIRFYLKRYKDYLKNDFLIGNLRLKIIGMGAKDIKSSLTLLIGDIKGNLIKIFVFSFLYLLIFSPFSIDFTRLDVLNEKLIDITSIFVGMVFVFIGFFYGDKDRAIAVYKKGIGDKEFKTDKYIISLAIITIVLAVISTLVCDIERNDIPNFLFEIPFISAVLSIKLQYLICTILTWFAIVLLIICFDSLINYYLRSMRNNFFIDAVNDLINDRKKKS